MATTEELERRITQLEHLLRNNGLGICPVCGGSTRTSNKFPLNENCHQDKGHCGEWILENLDGRKMGDWPKSRFIRTRIKGGKVQRLERTDYFKRILFVAGKAVDIDPAATQEQ